MYRQLGKSLSIFNEMVREAVDPVELILGCYNFKLIKAVHDTQNANTGTI